MLRKDFTMKRVIDIRDMHTAIHELYLVKHKPLTVIEVFAELTELGGDEDLYLKEIYWTFLKKNTEYLGEINFRNISGGIVTRNGKPLDDCVYNDGENKYKVIGRFDLWY